MYIRTDQLDGETDWKLRRAVSWCQKLSNKAELYNLDSIIYAEQPTKGNRPLALDGIVWQTIGLTGYGS